MTGSIYQMFERQMHPEENAQRQVRQETRAGRRLVLGFVALFAFCSSAHAVVDLGIEVLEQSNYAILKGKRVGLITNQTGVDRKGIRTRVLLRQNCNLVALYTPEHGLDG